MIFTLEYFDDNHLTDFYVSCLGLLLPAILIVPVKKRRRRREASAATNEKVKLLEVFAKKVENYVSFLLRLC